MIITDDSEKKKKNSHQQSEKSQKVFLVLYKNKSNILKSKIDKRKFFSSLLYKFSNVCFCFQSYFSTSPHNDVVKTEFYVLITE